MDTMIRYLHREIEKLIIVSILYFCITPRITYLECQPLHWREMHHFLLRRCSGEARPHRAREQLGVIL